MQSSDTRLPPSPGPASDTASHKPYDRIAVIGGGAWGTGLATVAARAGRDVRLWMRDPAQAEEMATRHTNSRYLGDLALPRSIRPMTDMAQALDGAEAVLLVTPSTTIRDMAGRIGALAAPGVPIFVCAKGIEADTGLLMSAVVEEAAEGRVIGTVTGPTFAAETAAGHPTAVTVACTSADDTPPRARAASRMALALTTGSFRPYVSDDMAGVEVGGAVKNVIAIACGILAGAGFGDNSRAAIITRGLDEMKELAVRLGGRRETVTGLGGLGDLILTCSSRQSRNFSYGFQRGQGIPDAQVFEGRPVVVEGRHNAITVTDLARKLGLEMPICEMVRAITAESQPIAIAFANFWAAPLRGEPRALDLEFDHPAVEAVTRHFEDKFQ
ncbi:NAD(P)H-dependent glycerol-3-phosphate dehydrogenase [Falsirhodobacter halotolerans]|uniref:NAD(P)H-dependent glycerol-3-phosphate dehydrogenase n=1 Tax=Falsirhodobacter halotolerans TaxID=1146892 RepID=UPI001FCF841D|nr:NAD(P)H-dependent glycerol-3-phosphate dehydrogenase [Falsirhodobacter halotolerans]MCJ8141172.1 NAD(P)-dependent glycerol-3-phosphate dehydrogenase [Falsirhodobacter halotolerans]